MSDNIVQLSNGDHAKLRPVEDVSERLRRPIAACMARISPEGQHILDDLRTKKVGETPAFSAEDLQTLNEMNDHAIVALVESWSFPEPITFDSVQSRRAKDYDALRTACAPVVGALFVDTGASTNPHSPTEPSSDLNTSSVEGHPIHVTDSPSTSEPTDS